MKKIFQIFFIYLLTCLPQVCHGRFLWIEPMHLTRDDTTQHCHRLAPQDRRPRRRSWPIPPVRSNLVGKADTLLVAATQPARPILAYPPPPPPNFRTEKQLTAPADRPVRYPAHAVASSTAVAIAIQVAPARFRAEPTCGPPATLPASPAIQTRSCADHHPLVAHHPVRGCDADPDVRRAVGVCMIGRPRAARSAPQLTSRSLSDCDRLRCEWTGWAKSGADRRRFWGAIAGPRQAACVRHLTGQPATQNPKIRIQRRCKVILKEPHARAA